MPQLQGNILNFPAPCGNKFAIAIGYTNISPDG